MKELTKAEEQVMHILWKLEKGIVKDIVGQFPDPKPAYTTVATVLKVLEKKGFVTHESVGNTYVYLPAITKRSYSGFQFSKLFTNYFNGSFPQMAAHFARANNLSIQDLDELIEQTKKELDGTQQAGKFKNSKS